MAIFNPNRKTGGTIELVRDANGNYSTKEVGFNTLASLSIPDFKTTATTTTTTDTKTATDITGDTVDTQTQMAFQMPETGGGGGEIDTTGEMLQTAKQTSDMLAETFDSKEMTKRDEAKITSPLQIKEADERISAQEAAPQEDIGAEGITNFTDYQDAILRGQVGTKFQKQPKFGDILFKPGPAFDDKGTAFARPEERTIDQASKDRAVKDDSRFLPSNIETRSDKGEIVAPGVEAKPYQDAIMRGETGIKPEIKRNALETVSTSLKISGDSILSKIKTPMMMVMDMAKGSPQQQNRNEFNASYFNVRSDGRIAGNPSTDVFAGMNRQSMSGDVGKSARGRVETRTNTISKRGVNDLAYAQANNLTYNPKGVSVNFVETTNNFKDQINEYQGAKNKSDLDKGPGALGPAGGATLTSGSDQGGGKGGKNKIVCTMMNESYGFGSFRNKIWLRHSKNLAPEYQRGYHRLFLPLVKKAKTNKILKKILEHIAVHRTIDIRQQERNKIHLIGRVYRTILEPICYWAGKK